jgi:hypothetical protein
MSVCPQESLQTKPTKLRTRDLEKAVPAQECSPLVAVHVVPPCVAWGKP